MSPTSLSRPSSQHRIDDAELISALRNALDGKYGRLVQAARREWERSFRGPDPSDACVSVRITGAPGVPRVLGGRHYLAY